MDRGRRGRETAGAMIAAVVLLYFLGGFLFIAAPGHMGGGTQGPPVGLIGIAMAVVGLIWMIRIYRGTFEPDQNAWRYRRLGRAMPLRPEDNVGDVARGRRGRTIGRAMIIFAALVLPASVLILFIAAPGFTGGSIGATEPPPIELVGAAIYILGLGWMIRIYRANPEPDQGAWRYRSH